MAHLKKNKWFTDFYCVLFASFTVLLLGIILIWVSKMGDKPQKNIISPINSSTIMTLVDEDIVINFNEGGKCTWKKRNRK